ncbi:MAG: hypothetical protein IKP67_00180 [Spirochaetales bacterium]|nr:hypothetical protein [Spirochaetales bacterium]
MIQQSRRLISRMAETVRRHRITVRETTVLPAAPVLTMAETVHHPQVRMTTVHLHRLSK